ncbi:MAG: hypothetical protein MI723_01955 [Caulobacterales bacterium]|nr:hypothetical protein [Caulobacterales bacterium]
MAKFRIPWRAAAAQDEDVPGRDDVAPALDAPALQPEDFAPFPDAELEALAARIAEEPEDRRRAVLGQSSVGAALLACSPSISADAVVGPLMTMWGPDRPADDGAQAA